MLVVQWSIEEKKRSLELWGLHEDFSLFPEALMSDPDGGEIEIKDNVEELVDWATHKIHHYIGKKVFQISMALLFCEGRF